MCELIFCTIYYYKSDQVYIKTLHKIKLLLKTNYNNFNMQHQTIGSYYKDKLLQL